MKSNINEMFASFVLFLYAPICCILGVCCIQCTLLNTFSLAGYDLSVRTVHTVNFILLPMLDNTYE